MQSAGVTILMGAAFGLAVVAKTRSK
jgi:hypothetical protein